jgi:CheY-like chemotaxis protein
VERSKAAGFEIHLTKPIQFAALSSALHSLFAAEAAP